MPKGSRYSVRDICRELAGQSFKDTKSFEKTFLKLFNKHLADFPPNYSYRNGIEMAQRNRWIIISQGEWIIRNPIVGELL